MRNRALGLLVLGILRVARLDASPGPLEVVRAGPTGEIAALEEANEIRITFSEPMVALGRPAQAAAAPYFSIAPTVRGALRWAGTDTLVFTPSKPLPWAASYTVTVAAGAAAASGARLAAPYVFSFRTPTLKLLKASWYRRSGRSGSPVVLALFFNQPVRAAALAPRLSVRYEPHDFAPPAMPAGLERWKALDPQGLAAFEAKVERVRAAAASDAAVPFRPAKTWNEKWFPPAPAMAVFETAAAPAVEGWLSVRVGSQSLTLRLEPAFFVTGFRCEERCNPDDENPLRFTAPLSAGALRTALSVADVTAGADRRLVRKPAAAGENAGYERELYPASTLDWQNTAEFWRGEATPEEAGYSLEPAKTYAARLSPALRSTDGQVLGYGWIGTVENWHQSAFTSFGEGQGVWEASGGPQLPFAARNFRTVKQWLAPVAPDAVLETLRALQAKGFNAAPPGPPTDRQLAPVPDRIQSYSLDLKPLLSPRGTGVVWAALGDGEAIPRAQKPEGSGVSASLVQVTNLGLSVKDSPDNTLVFVTRLDDATPVAGAKVAIRTGDGKVFWSGTTGADGIVLAPTAGLRSPERWWELAFLVTAEKDGDFAYVGSDWNEGTLPWAFNLPFDLEDAAPLLRGVVFADRGVYKLGEEVHLKAIARSDTARGVGLLPPGTVLDLVVRDGQGAEIDKRAVALSEWGTADWVLKLPAEGPLGNYSVTASQAAFKRPIEGRFLVAAYRRPEFRVDTTLSGETSLAGGALQGAVSGRYLFGAPMADRPVRWTYTRRRLDTVPRAIRDRFPEDRWTFLGDEDESARPPAAEPVQNGEGKLDAEGRLALALDTSIAAGAPFDYTLEGEVADVSRQKIAGRATFRVDPAPWYVGIGRLPYFAEAGKPVETTLVAASLSGTAAAGVALSVDLVRIQWTSVRRAEGRGFYTWESEKKEVPAGHFDLTTAEGAVPLTFTVTEGGYYVIRATAKDDRGRSTTTSSGFYALGGGYTAWQRYDSNRIDLVPEKSAYRPGEEARLLVKSPWEKATALLTVEREGIRTYRTFTLSSTQETVRVPITEADIPNLYVSVLLVKGRSAAYTGDDTSDPGRPAFRLGYAELKVENASRKLSVAVTADREEYRPAAKAHVAVSVSDAAGKPDAAEVTLWAVDYGVLSLTGYRTPDALDAVYVDKALSVLNEDSRQKIVSRRVTVSKGAGEGGGGGAEEGPEGGVRRDFRVLAFWLGSLATDAQGTASADVTLPESLTTYRIMAVAADKASRFGRGDREIRISKPVLLRAAFPRFLAAGDAAMFGAVLNSQLKAGGSATVAFQSLDPQVLELAGEGRRVLEVGPKSATEVRFPVRAKAAGTARIRMTVSLSGETDAFEQSLPVRVLAAPDVSAAYGEADPTATQTIAIPAGVVPDAGGLDLQLSSTALVNLGEGARYLVDYPYGCAEQRASAALALMLAADLGSAFRIPDLEPARLRDTARGALRELAEFQCPSGSWGFWKSDCQGASPYLTAYVVSVLQRARSLGYAVDAAALERALSSLEAEVGKAPPSAAEWGPSYAAWQAFSVKVLAEGGRNADSALTRLYGQRDRMPVFALAYLLDAFHAKGESGERPAELVRRIGNAILPEGGSAHVEELSDPYLLWFWSSNVRSTAIALGSLVRDTDDRVLPPRMVRWLLQVRQAGRWGNTQENAAAMAALVDYARKFEAQAPAFTATATLAGSTIASEAFEGRDAAAREKSVPMKDLLALRAAPATMALDLRREGTGVLHYGVRLTTVSAAPDPAAADHGIAVERSYAAAGAGSESGPPATEFAPGSLVRVTLTLTLPKERRFVAVTDPLPAGFEPVESWFATTAADLVRAQEGAAAQDDWLARWQRGGFDHVERRDDRVLLFATRLSAGTHTFSYLARATTFGRFDTAPARAEEMYEPEVSGRTSGAVVRVGE